MDILSFGRKRVFENIGDPEAGNGIGLVDDRVRTDAHIAGTSPSSGVSGVPRGQGSEHTVGP